MMKNLLWYNKSGASLSVHLNIAGGCSRKSKPGRSRFFEIARGPVIEIDAALGIAHQLSYAPFKNCN